MVSLAVMWRRGAFPGEIWLLAGQVDSVESRPRPEAALIVAFRVDMPFQRPSSPCRLAAPSRQAPAALAKMPLPRMSGLARPRRRRPTLPVGSRRDPRAPDLERNGHNGDEPEDQQGVAYPSQPFLTTCGRQHHA